MTTSMNERTHFFIKIYLSHYILERVDVGYVGEVSWRRGQTATYSPQVLLAIAALLSHLGWVAQPWVTEGLKSSVCRWLSIRHLLSNWLQPPTDSSRLYPGYIFVWRPSASAVLPLIYTGLSLDWRLGRGSICYRWYMYEMASIPDILDPVSSPDICYFVFPL